jgi:hypothetical protein
MLGVSVTDRLEPFTLPLSIPPLVLLELVETHVPESEAPDCEIVARMFADAPRLSIVVPTHVPSIAFVDVEPGPTGRPHDNAEIRSRTTQPRLSIGMKCSRIGVSDGAVRRRSRRDCILGVSGGLPSVSRHGPDVARSRRLRPIGYNDSNGFESYLFDRAREPGNTWNPAWRKCPSVVRACVKRVCRITAKLVQSVNEKSLSRY